MTHFLQSAAWAAFQQSLGRTVISDKGDDWSYQAILEKGRFNTRLYCPYGPEVASVKALDSALHSLQEQARRLGATFIRIEPTGSIKKSDLIARKLRYVSYNQLQPEQTQLIDLTQPEADIIAQMQQNNRNIYRNFHKKGLSIDVSHDPHDLPLFTALVHQVASRNTIRTHSDNYFQKQVQALFPLQAASLYFVRLESRVIAAALVYDSDTTRYYAHAAADDSFRKLSAGTALLGHMITDAKAKGLTSFDLYGIAPSDDPSHPWAGFTKFKQSFGGTPYHYVGSWDLPVRSLTYHLYRLYQTIMRQLR